MANKHKTRHYDTSGTHVFYEKEFYGTGIEEMDMVRHPLYDLSIG